MGVAGVLNDAGLWTDAAISRIPASIEPAISNAFAGANFTPRLSVGTAMAASLIGLVDFAPCDTYGRRSLGGSLESVRNR